ncbi:MAG: hypothetical protein RJB66_2516 [Pseudomonadota bacterium]|jgi:enterochelin esterase family protein
MASSINHHVDTLCFPKFKNFELTNLTVNSDVLKKNPLGDSNVRNNPLLIPRHSSGEKLPLVLVLPGFASNGTKYLGEKGFEENFMQQLDRLAGQNKIPKALFLFADTWTFWGGSQFINSPAIGDYEDYLTKEVIPAVVLSFSIDSRKTAVMGQSSGGYGALHLASKYPDLFKYCGALAPDCFFEASLLPDLYKSAPFLSQNLNYAKLKELHQRRHILRQKNGFSILNVIAMTACYSPGKNQNQLLWPMNFQTGNLEKSIWGLWQKRDPIYFLPKRKSGLRKLKGLFLDVGNRDEFNLQLGTRQIHHFLKLSGIKHHYSEFDGGHFEAHDRYPLFWEWLGKKWAKI